VGHRHGMDEVLVFLAIAALIIIWIVMLNAVLAP
jgi:hypothetical protein